MLYTIGKYANGWYCFEGIPQDNSYIKVANLNCGSDKKAKNLAWRLLKKSGVGIEHSALCFADIV
jgi:hypothetical protein